MRGNAALKQADQDYDAELSRKMDEFARALTDLSHQHGIGIEGAVLYAMEQEDHAFSYAIDDESRIIRA